MPELLTPNMLGFPSPRALDGAVRQWEPDASRHKGPSLMPVKNYPFQTVEWDELDPVTGLTAAHNMSNNPTIVKAQVRKKHSEPAMYFKEKARIEEADILTVRALGSFDRLAGRDLLMERTRQLMMRLDARIEKLRWDSICGSVAISENGIARTISYTLLATPTASPTWDNSSGLPIDDIQTWAALMRGKTSGLPVCLFNNTVARKLAQNAQVRDLVKQSSGVKEIGLGQVAQLVSDLTGVATLMMYDEGYLGSGGFTPFIPDDTFIMIGVPPDGQELGYFYTTPSVHRGGMNPQPGRFSFTKDGLNEDNPFYDVGTGIYGVPALRFPNLVIKATV